MAYKDFDGSSSTQTAGERAAEAKRILTRIGPEVRCAADRDEVVAGRGWTEQAMKFVCEQLWCLELGDELTISAKQLFWLRDLAEAIE